MYLESRNWALLVNCKMRWKRVSLWHFYEYFNNSHSSFEKKNIWFPDKKKRRFNETWVLCISKSFLNFCLQIIFRVIVPEAKFSWTCCVWIRDQEHRVLLQRSEIWFDRGSSRFWETMMLCCGAFLSHTAARKLNLRQNYYSDEILSHKNEDAWGLFVLIEIVFL